MAFTLLLSAILYSLSSPGALAGVDTIANPASSPVKVHEVGNGTPDKVLSATTASTGTNWTSLASQSCTAVTVVNLTGTTISARIGGTGNSVSIPDNTAVKLYVAANANEISLRRSDTSNTQVTLAAIATK